VERHGLAFSTRSTEPQLGCIPGQWPADRLMPSKRAAGAPPLRETTCGAHVKISCLLSHHSKPASNRAGTCGGSMMNHSIYSADRTTHLKIVVVASLSGLAVAGLALSSRVGSPSGTITVIKARDTEEFGRHVHSLNQGLTLVTRAWPMKAGTWTHRTYSALAVRAFATLMSSQPSGLNFRAFGRSVHSSLAMPSRMPALCPRNTLRYR
jgi:hypothetical protein